ncbi:hypothetical protein, partial [Thiolapillus sp.]|uniref:hypothetical protein n=1 Tax=Thiolapillus sp. TaxID=2017437 RepID=UPI003AF5736B
MRTQGFKSSTSRVYGNIPNVQLHRAIEGRLSLFEHLIKPRTAPRRFAVLMKGTRRVNHGACINVHLMWSARLLGHTRNNLCGLLRN